MLNKYFCSVTNIDDSDKELPVFDDRGANVIEGIVIFEQDVIDMISVLDPNKAVGSDMISNKMLTAVKDDIALPLSMLFNKSLRCKIYPSSWKEAFVIPLFKRGIRSLLSNYRPVALL